MSGTPELVVASMDPSGRMELIEPGERTGTGACVDFRRIELTGLSRQPLVKACGPKGALVDATAGLGSDAWILAASGFTVICIERSRIVAAVLDDGIARAQADPALSNVASRITLKVGDARLLIAQVLRAEARTGAALYLDPMYPHKEGSALAPKPIRLVRIAVGDGEDAHELVDAGRAAGFKRIVVKRPHHAPPLAGDPHHVIEGKLARFDVYLGHTTGATRSSE